MLGYNEDMKHMLIPDGSGSQCEMQTRLHQSLSKQHTDEYEDKGEAPMRLWCVKQGGRKFIVRKWGLEGHFFL